MRELWQSLQTLFQQWTGMFLPHTMQAAALEVVTRLASEAQRSPSAFLHELSHDARQRQRLLDEIGLGTTWFMREQAGLFALAETLARTTPKGQPVWLWSAGCSSGEEPYSLAIIMAEAGLPAHILATDINRRSLRRAFDGRYRTRALERVPREWRTRYFEDAGPGMVRVTDAIRQCVTFELHNFRTHAELPAGWHRFDAVVCRNSLMYFDRAEAVQIIGRLTNRCRPGGYLLLGAIERPLLWMRDRSASGHVGELVEIASDARLRLPDGQEPAASTKSSSRVHMDLPRARPSVSTQRTDTLETLLDQAEAAEQLGRIDEALSLLDAAVAAMPLSAAAHLARGLVLKRAGRTQDAIEAFRAARFLDDQGWLAPFQLALCLEAMGDPEEAYDAYRHALDILEAQGPSGLARLSAAVENLATTVAEVCRARVHKGTTSSL